MIRVLCINGNLLVKWYEIRYAYEGREDKTVK